MQINHQKQPRSFPRTGLALALLAAVLLPQAVAGTENEPAEEPRPETEVTQSQPASQEAQTDTGKPRHAGEQSPPATGNKAKPVKLFKPSETIGADSAVSFPIDI